jgi:hypothetical protein
LCADTGLFFFAARWPAGFEKVVRVYDLANLDTPTVSAAHHDTLRNLVWLPDDNTVLAAFSSKPGIGCAECFVFWLGRGCGLHGRWRLLDDSRTR